MPERAGNVTGECSEKALEQKNKDVQPHYQALVAHKLISNHAGSTGGVDVNPRETTQGTHSKPGLCTYHTKDDLLHLSPMHRAQCCCSHKILKAQHTSGTESPQQVQYQLIADDLMK